MLKHLAIIIFTSLNFLNAFAISIPADLSRADVDDVARLLGFNTSPKLLSQPYPLGGFSGLEIGISQQVVDVQELSALGDQSSDEDTFSFNQLNLGKGLYNNVDIYFEIVPFSRANQVSEYGALIKWGFYEAEYLPLSLALLAYVNSINIQDNYINQSSGGDLLAAVNTERFSLYMGAGNVSARSLFKNNILDASFGGREFKDTYDSFHSFVGVTANVSYFFIAGQIDRYEDPVYSFRVGLRLQSAN